MKSESSYLRKIISRLWSSDDKKALSNIYTILDTARDEVIYSKIVASDIECVCLYEGEDARQLEDVAPYLIRLYKDHPFTMWLLNNGWGESWGIFIESSASLKELAHHFRKFLVVADENGTQMYFRYYDPRVWRVYLPTCNEGELEYVFGPVERYFVESEKNEMVEYTLSDEQLVKRIKPCFQSTQVR